ncbi:hypothetical protein E2C01_063951 [Portunus trituberculatus]|uniref:Uncharacterized protein n=1 Tax=Portunus trituberculatus TaxID=210409 RepID=A0A5B7HBV1_PORTR|nr:hypothetical protein [Portunus trituberculatus]
MLGHEWSRLVSTHPLLVTSALLTQTAVNLSCRRHTSFLPHLSRPHNASGRAQ